jgi:hypothetical protein
MQGTRVTLDLTLEVKYFTVPIARYAVLSMPPLLSYICFKLGSMLRRRELVKGHVVRTANGVH